MKIAILTFQFAHNYGAVLQAYGLKEYLEKIGCDVKIAPYYPEWAKKEYAVSPLTKGISNRKRARLFLQYLKRRKLAQKFKKFQTNYLQLEDSFSATDTLEKYLNGFDFVFFGSDQIWNDKITGESTAYYGGNIKSTRVSYAASLGTKNLSKIQKKCVLKYLPLFKAISVRETSNERLLSNILDKPISTVIDPVFLLDRNDWECISKSVEVKNRFIFLYFLRDDDKLLNYARKYARENGLVIYEAHPTLAGFHKGTVHLFDIGPEEFLWLVNNANCVCTNSFHALSLGIIFKKKIIHIPNQTSPERTIDLLARVGYEIIDSNKKLPLYDFEKYDGKTIEEYINTSVEFISRVIKNG